MTLVFKVKQNLALVFDYLSDMQKFVSIHPVISKIDVRGNNNYLVHETLKIVGIPITFSYPVTVISDEKKHEVLIKATVMKLTKIEMRFKLSQQKDHTLLEELITFNSPLPVKSMMQTIFRKQHAQLFKNMDALILNNSQLQQQAAVITKLVK